MLKSLLIAFALQVAAGLDMFVISMCGDIMMGTTYPTVMLPTNDGADIFSDPLEVLSQADLTVGNLEGTLCDGGSCTKKLDQYNYAFRTPTSYGALLKEAGFDYMSLANNHSNDFGDYGIASTEYTLDKQGIAHSGILYRQEWAVIQRSGVRFGICAFGHNRHTLKLYDFEKVKAVLDTLKTQSDIIIVSFHGGAEGPDKGHLFEGPEFYLGENRGDIKSFAHFCIDNGASVVYGHGPHVTRCIEVYKSRFIAYSLGNFCTPYGISTKGLCGYAPVVSVRLAKDGSFIDGKIHSFIQTYGQGPKKDQSYTVANHIRNLSEMDVPNNEASIDTLGYIIPKRSEAFD